MTIVAEIGPKEYLHAVLRGDGRRAVTFVEQAVQEGWGLSRIIQVMIHPALVEVGVLWEDAKISVADEHLATATSQLVLAHLFSVMDPAPSNGRSAIVSCTPGELHGLGALMVADVLERDGWAVLNLGANTPAEPLLQLVLDRPVDVVALSTVRATGLPEARRLIAGLRRVAPGCLIVVGGRAYGGNPDLATALGADGLITDLDLLSERLMTLLEQR